MMVEWWIVAWGWIWTWEPIWTAFASVGELLVVVVGGRDEGVDLGSEALVVEVEVGRGAPMMALVWMSVLDWTVSGACMERMYALGWTSVSAPMVIACVPLT